MTDPLGRQRDEAAAQVAALTAEFAAIVESTEFTATDDEHDPDGSTIGFERARVAGLLERARGRLAAVDAALARASRGDYGICVVCQAPISAERLEALPATERCIACAI